MVYSEPNGVGGLGMNQEQRRTLKQEQLQELAKEKREAMLVATENSNAYERGSRKLKLKDFGRHIDSDSDDTEVLRWSHFAEDCGWPHPNTGYGPWSD